MSETARQKPWRAPCGLCEGVEVSRKRLRHRQEDPSAAWGSGSGKPLTSSRWFRVGGVVFMLLLGGVVAILVWLPENRKKDKVLDVVVKEDAGLEAEKDVKYGIEGAEGVAKSFLAENDPHERLRWVRDGDDVLLRMGAYSKEAREAPGELEKMIGHVSEDGRTVTAFVVAMPSGEVSLLEVVETAEGPKVDWDAYARYSTASWEDLLSGKAEQAVVRVFCEPSSERPEPFGNQAEWTCFRLSSPDLPQAVLGFAEAGSVREVMMKNVILGTPGYRQRFTLEVVRHDGKDEPLFEITPCLAVGWILDERDMEEVWSE